MKKRLMIAVLGLFVGLGFSCEDNFPEVTETEIIEIPNTDDEDDERVDPDTDNPDTVTN